jgi:preprotein translocase subunit YajC
MHLVLTILAAGPTTTTHSSSKSSGSTYTLLFIVVIFAAVYLLFIRPRQQRMRQQQSAARQLSVGDPVVTAGGVHGRLVAIDDNVAEVEIAPGVVITLLRRAVSARQDTRAPSAPPSPPTNEDWPNQRGPAADAGDDEKPDDTPEQHP